MEAIKKAPIGAIASQLAAWAWLVGGIEGAGNLFVVMAWLKLIVVALFLVICILMLSDEERASNWRGKVKQPSRIAAGFVNLHIAVLTVLLAWHGHIGYALMVASAHFCYRFILFITEDE